MPHRAEAGRNQTAVRQVTDAKRNVDLVFEKVRHAIGHDETDRHLGEGIQEARHDWQHMHPAETGQPPNASA